MKVAENAAVKPRSSWIEARAAHARLLDLMDQLQHSATTGDMFDARLRVLSELVSQQARDAQAALVPAAEATSVDLIEVGARMAARMDDLRARAAARDVDTGAHAPSPVPAGPPA